MRFFKVFFVMFVLLFACTGAKGGGEMNKQEHKHKFTNRLIKETSPYLQQHAHNPVDWYPWGEEALQRAKQENKILLISIGYSACHWCHVMEAESFENEEIAGFMNENFICIKVDREERPDIDQVYMSAVQLLTGAGGWPLNCFALPDGKPFYGGTYFPPGQWRQVLAAVAETYKKDPGGIKDQAEKLTNGIGSAEMILTRKDQAVVARNDLELMYQNWERRFDKKYGGNKGAPKFPMPNNYLFLLHYSNLINSSKLLAHINHTLTSMANGGIYDHLGGGFARYSVDEKWHVPHFEKMLYDNGQMLSLYSEAYRYTNNEKYRKIVYHTAAFLNREMADPAGGFYSAFDADSQGEEGKFYVWSYGEVKKILGKNNDLFCDVYNVSEQGNWEGKNILHIIRNPHEFGKKYNLSPEELTARLDEAVSLLLAERDKREKPGLDDKILTAWTGLVVQGFCDAYKAFADERFLQSALKGANFIKDHQLHHKNQLWRKFKNGKATINGFLDDYAFTIQALISIFQVTFEDSWLQLAKSLTDYVVENFYHKNSGMFFYTSSLAKKLAARKMEITDNVIPSSNSVMAFNLHQLGRYFYKSGYQKISHQMLLNVSGDLPGYGPFYSNWGRLLASSVYPGLEVVIIGDQALKFRKELEMNYLPNIVVSGSLKQNSLPLHQDRFVKGETKIYVCSNNSCKLPVDNVSDALEQIKNR